MATDVLLVLYKDSVNTTALLILPELDLSKPPAEIGRNGDSPNVINPPNNVK